MSFPKTMAEMKSQEYIFSNVGVCKGCGEEVEWWITPKGKRLIMNLMASEDAQAIAHWATCEQANHFRR